MLIVFPLGLLATGVVFDILYLVNNNESFSNASFWMITAGILGGLLAAIFGLIDWLAIPGGTRAKSVGLLHGAGNVVIVLLFAISWLLRRDAPDYTPSTLAFILELAGAGLAVITGWLGGELVYRLRVGVDQGANLDAPNSLTSEAVEADSRRARR
jgi:uncharacterized membrane protein